MCVRAERAVLATSIRDSSLSNRQLTAGHHQLLVQSKNSPDEGETVHCFCGCCCCWERCPVTSAIIWSANQLYSTELMQESLHRRQANWRLDGYFLHLVKWMHSLTSYYSQKVPLKCVYVYKRDVYNTTPVLSVFIDGNSLLTLKTTLVPTVW